MLKLSSVRMERAGKSLAKLKIADAISADELAFAAWPARLASASPRTPAQSFVRGRLIVEVDDAIWQKQLFHLRFEILAQAADDSRRRDRHRYGVPIAGQHRAGLRNPRKVTVRPV